MNKENKKSCPICGKETDPKYKPFCCKRCSDVDLHGWFSGSYAIEGDEAASVPEAEDEE